MKAKSLFCLLVLAGVLASCKPGATEASWIAAPDADGVSTWTVFRKNVTLGCKPSSRVLTIAADTKYWLYVNGELAVFEGGLKRGPYRASSSYYDEVDIAPWLKRGENQVEVLLWHFGKSGFSHVDSGKAALYVAGKDFDSDGSWTCCLHPSYGICGDPQPNYRLAESCLLYDATKSLCDSDFAPAQTVGAWGDEPWGEMVLRPIPQFKDFGIVACDELITCPASSASACDTVKTRLPYNMQMTPVLALESDSDGAKVIIRTDHSFHGATDNIRAEYIAKAGRQVYESLGWMNGEELQVILPEGVRLLSLGYRETGYASEPSGEFDCSDEFYNIFWEKALRTLYVNMRDNFFDCPDRERAQWWGDVTVMMGELFYSYDEVSHDLMRKAIYELCDWQKEDGGLSSPIPGNYKHELPGQMLASIGRYGIYTYYEYTGDLETISHAYPVVKKYLELWTLDESGLTEFRKGGWTWGDWGDNKDLRLIYGALHYMALDGAAKMADLLGEDEDAAAYRADMRKVRAGYNQCWDGEKYRHPDYTGETDDRAQALAVVAGIAGTSKYEAIFETLRKEEHASPYMEKYVMEALFIMGHGDYALERTHKRFESMVNDPARTTLFEGWEIGSKAFGGGTTNHAWSGGSLTVLARYLCGIKPVDGGFKRFVVDPRPELMERCSISVPTPYGFIQESWNTDEDGRVAIEITVPEGTKCCYMNRTDTKCLRGGRTYTFEY